MGKSQYILRGSFKAAMLKNMERRRNLFDAVANDKDLDLRLRGNEIHVYFRGGKILGISPSSYNFDEKYTSTKTEKEIINEDIKRVESEPEKYFADAKKIMNQWFKFHEKQERDDQHHIACANREFTENNDLVVIDIEFTVSTLSNVYNKASRKHSRFDIIAVDRTGQLYVLELKTGLDAISNMQDHINDFNGQAGNDEIGYDTEKNEKRYITFAKEMNNVLQSLQTYFGYSKDIHIDINKKPVFRFAFTEKDKEDLFDKFNAKAKEIDTEAIKIEKPGYYLKLNA